MNQVSLRRNIYAVLKFLAVASLVALAIVLINRYGIPQLRAQVEQLGVWAPLGQGKRILPVFLNKGA